MFVATQIQSDRLQLCNFFCSRSAFLWSTKLAIADCILPGSLSLTRNTLLALQKHSMTRFYEQLPWMIRWPLIWEHFRHPIRFCLSKQAELSVPLEWNHVLWRKQCIGLHLRPWNPHSHLLNVLMVKLARQNNSIQNSRRKVNLHWRHQMYFLFRWCSGRRALSTWTLPKIHLHNAQLHSGSKIIKRKENEIPNPKVISKVHVF